MRRRILLLAVLLVPCLTAQVRSDDPAPNNGRQVADADLEAVKAIESAGGKVVRDPWREGKPVIHVDLKGKEVTNRLLGKVASCEQLQSLNLAFCDIQKRIRFFRGLRRDNAFSQAHTASGVRSETFPGPSNDAFWLSDSGLCGAANTHDHRLDPRT